MTDPTDTDGPRLPMIADADLPQRYREEMQRRKDAEARLSEVERERDEMRQALDERYRDPVWQKIEALAHDVVAAAAPVQRDGGKGRDETKPPPGWERYTFSDDDGVEREAKHVRREGCIVSREVFTLVEAWSRYDAEHGYAPPLPRESAVPSEFEKRAKYHLREMCDAAYALRLDFSGADQLPFIRGLDKLLTLCKKLEEPGPVGAPSTEGPRERALLHRFVDHETDPCQLDHHGYCQAHPGAQETGQECAVAEGRRLLAAAHRDTRDAQDDQLLAVAAAFNAWGNGEAPYCSSAMQAALNRIGEALGQPFGQFDRDTREAEGPPDGAAPERAPECPCWRPYVSDDGFVATETMGPIHVEHVGRIIDGLHVDATRPPDGMPGESAVPESVLSSLDQCAQRLDAAAESGCDLVKHMRVTAGQIRRALRELTGSLPAGMVGGRSPGSNPTAELSDSRAGAPSTEGPRERVALKKARDALTRAARAMQTLYHPQARQMLHEAAGEAVRAALDADESLRAAAHRDTREAEGPRDGTAPERPEWCEECREYRPCSTCTYTLCSMGCDRPLPGLDLVAAVQAGTALPSKAFCWGSPECEDIVAFHRVATRPPDGTAPERALLREVVEASCTLRLAYDGNLPYIHGLARLHRATAALDDATRPPDGMPGEPARCEHRYTHTEVIAGRQRVTCLDCKEWMPAGIPVASPPTVPGEPPAEYEVFPVHRESGPTIWQVRLRPDPCTKKREDAVALAWAHRNSIAAPPTPPRALVDADSIPRTSGNGCVCWECGLGIAIDEDGCCVHCGGQAGTITRLHDLADEARKFTECAPVDEAAVRADERAKTERDIADELERSGYRVMSSGIRIGNYPRTSTPTPEGADHAE